MKVTRKLNWISSLDSGREPEMQSLIKRITEFYEQHSDYYKDIDFTADNWINSKEAGYKQIVSHALNSGKICEVGCGSANILKHFPQLRSGYSGCDFSEDLIQINQAKYKEALFRQIKHPDKIPFDHNQFNLVFSVFVLEHCTDPSAMLNECDRILEPGGRLIILCPDFLGRGRMSSQRAGLSEGNSGTKLKAGRYFDAFLTFFDNRIRIPFHCFLLRRKARKSAQFYINLQPTVFTDKFYPDADAVYLTYKEEIVKFLEGRFRAEPDPDEITSYTKSKKLIYLSFIKNDNGL